MDAAFRTSIGQYANIILESEQLSSRGKCCFIVGSDNRGFGQLLQNLDCALLLREFPLTWGPRLVGGRNSGKQVLSHGLALTCRLSLDMSV